MSRAEQRALLPALLLSLLIHTGCATMLSGRTQSVQVDSKPSGATVEVFVGSDRIGQHRVTLTRGERVTTTVTPNAIELLRKNDYILVFNKSGYQEASIPVCKMIDGNPFVLFNLLNLGIGLPVDLFTGAAQALEPNVFALLDGREPAAAESEPEFVCRPK